MGFQKLDHNEETWGVSEGVRRHGGKKTGPLDLMPSGTAPCGDALCIVGRTAAFPAFTCQLPGAPPPTVTTNNVFRYCQMSSDGKTTPG